MLLSFVMFGLARGGFLYKGKGVIDQVCFDFEKWGKGWEWFGDDDPKSATNCRVCASFINDAGAVIPKKCVNSMYNQGDKFDTWNCIGASPYRNTNYLWKDAAGNWNSNNVHHESSYASPLTVRGHWDTIVSIDCGLRPEREWGMDEAAWIDRIRIRDMDPSTGKERFTYYGASNDAGWCMSPTPNTNDWKWFESKGLKVPAKKCMKTMRLDKNSNKVFDVTGIKKYEDKTKRLTRRRRF